jgi:hypothetical protein
MVALFDVENVRACLPVLISFSSWIPSCFLVRSAATPSNPPRLRARGLSCDAHTQTLDKGCIGRIRLLQSFPQVISPSDLPFQVIAS